MQKCRFSITTNADGQENSITGEGELSLSGLSATLYYTENDVQTSILIKDGKVTLIRSGAYSLSLPLQEGERSQGTISIGNTLGDVEAYTHAFQYAIRKNSLLISLKYDLLFGEEIQKMQLRVYACELKTEKNL